MSSDSHFNPLLIIISGPSGVGKDAVIFKMKDSGVPFHHVVTATTRPKRPGEKDGVDYYFLSQEQFQRRIKAKQFIEWAKVYDNHYGVLKEEIEKALNGGQDVIVKVDIQGATTIKKILPDAVFIFLRPQSIDELAERLKKRRGQTEVELNLRLGEAREEMKNLSLFDYVVLNCEGDLAHTVSQINAIVTAEKCRVKPRVINL